MVRIGVLSDESIRRRNPAFFSKRMRRAQFYTLYEKAQYVDRVNPYETAHEMVVKYQPTIKEVEPVELDPSQPSQQPEEDAFALEPDQMLEEDAFASPEPTSRLARDQGTSTKSREERIAGRHRRRYVTGPFSKIMAGMSPKNILPSRTRIAPEDAEDAEGEDVDEEV